MHPIVPCRPDPKSGHSTALGPRGACSGDSLFYGAAGVAFVGWGDVSDALSEDTTVGFVVGLGVEHKITSNLSIGVEGLYYNFSTEGEIQEGLRNLSMWT